MRTEAETHVPHAVHGRGPEHARPPQRAGDLRQRHARFPLRAPRCLWLGVPTRRPHWHRAGRVDDSGRAPHLDVVRDTNVARPTRTLGDGSTSSAASRRPRRLASRASQRTTPKGSHSASVSRVHRRRSRFVPPATSRWTRSASPSRTSMASARGVPKTRGGPSTRIE